MAAVGPIRLTQHVRSAGSACRIVDGAGQEPVNPRGSLASLRIERGQEAGVIFAETGKATILGVEMISPVVDDPLTFGQIAAAHALGTVYAMGGTPQAAVSIVGFPANVLPAEVLREILRGAEQKMREAGVHMLGAHTTNDADIKCGFAVMGSAAAEPIGPATAQAGDAIVLTKPLGSGIIVFAHQVGLTLPGAMESLTRSLLALDRQAASSMIRLGVHAAASVSATGLIGRLAQIASGSAVACELEFEELPLFRGVVDLAERDLLPGTIERNIRAIDPTMLDLQGLTSGQKATLFCPETSGGLVIVLPQEQARLLVNDLRQADPSSGARIIGRVCAAHEKGLIRVRANEPRPEGYYSTETASRPG